MTQAQERVWSEAFSDAELISAVREGDTSAYGALYERHAAAARTVARQYVRSTADADDVVSDAFARTLSVLQGGGGPDVTFRAYLFTVVRRLSYDLVNGARRTQPTDDERTFETAFGPMASTEDPTLEGFERSTVTRAYQDLPERWRAVLWYTEVENLSPAEIAPILGLTANGVSALAYRAREGLRQAYLQQHLTSVPAEECRTVNALLGSYVRGGLAKRETARVESHLDGCGECRALVLELGDVSHGMRAVIAPLVLGVGALGLVGTALPTVGGAAVAGGVGAALQGSSSGGAGSAGGSGAAGGSGGAGAGAGGGAAGTGAVGGAGAAASAAGGSGAAVGAGAASVGGAAAAAGGAAAGSGALAAAGAGGLVALVTSAPLAAAAVTVGVLTVAGLGVAGALGAFSSDPAPTPTSQSSPSPSASPTTGTTTTPDPTTDPTSPTNIPPAPTDQTTAGSGDTTGTGSGSTDGSTPVGSTPGTTTPGGSTGPGTPAPTDPGTGTPGPTDPGTGTPEPAPAALELSLAPVTLAARVPADLVITASNTGGRAAEEVFVDLTLPAGVTTPGSSLVARGTVVGSPLSAASLPCGSAVPQPDGTSLVTCSVGILDPGESQELVVRVEAESGGDYPPFAASVRATGIPAKPWTFPSAPVRYYGPEVRVVAPSDGLRLDNPGEGVLRVVVRNSGDQPLVEPRLAVDLPSGVTLAGGSAGVWTCATDEGRSVTCAAPSGTSLAPGAASTVPLTLVADRDRAVEKAVVRLRGTAPDARAGSADASVDVARPWDGAASGVDGDGLRVQCSARGEAGAASVTVPFTNRTAYGDLRAALVVAGTAQDAVPVAPGRSVDLRGGTGGWLPAGDARVVLSTTVAGQQFTHEIVAGEHPAIDCFDWKPVTGAARATAAWAVPSGAGVGTSVVTGTFHNPYSTTTLRVGMSTPHGDAAPVDVAPGADATFTVDAKALSVPAGTATFTVERAAPAGPAPTTVEARYAAVTYDPRWATSATVDAGWQDGSVKIVGTLTNDSPETIDVVMSAAGYGDSAPAQQVAPGATVTLTVDTRALDVKAGAVTFRQSRTVLGTPFADARLTARYQGAGYQPDWSATPTVSAQCAPGAGGVVLSVGLRNDSTEAMHVVARTPFGDRDLGDVAPGASTGADLATGALAVKAGKVELVLSRTVLGVPFTETLPVRFDAVDCAVEQPAASLVLGDPYYDARRGHSYRAVSVLLDNSGSNVPVTFRVTGHAKGEWTVGAGERRTESLGEAPWSGATYVVHTRSWTEQLKVEGFTAVAECAPEWQAGVWYDHDAEVSYDGWNYTARNGSAFVRPDRDLIGLFWERGERCGEG
ncbi:sigma-70 family RNA polymerase sigma factor [Cellulosimicrobium sp. 22601]|uniref:sigma-70 family RNA polymerase sigma factor n=1 Tax=unclassified Cellulosimicrobium TaxID=2624466 RepID=UPI003F859DDE